MKWKILRQIIVMTKYAFYGIFLQALLGSVLLANSGLSQNKSWEKVRISLQENDLTLEDAFNAISEQTSFYFTYNENTINLHASAALPKKSSVAEILTILSKEHDLKFKRINDDIFVSRKKWLEEPLEEKITTTRQVTITGTITSASAAEPLPGVSIIIKGTSQGTTTDIDGKYAISTGESDVLQFSYIGYVTQEIAVGVQNIINVQLEEDLSQLEEVVVIGYGSREKKDLTGAISVIDSDATEKTASLNPQLAMQGRMTGVFVSSPGGDPSSRPQVRIRGVGTFQGAGGYAEPLYVIDGIPVSEPFEENAERGVPVFQDVRGTQNILNTINPADIESISVLKDASAAAIYGVRAANGVILITTKKGKAGRPKVNFTASYGIQNNNQRHDVLNTQQYLDFALDMLQNIDLNDPDQNDGTLDYYNQGSDLYLGNSTNNDDWQEAIQNENAAIQDYNISISGGNDASNYYASFGYANQEGTLIGSEIDRYSLALNSDHKLNKWLKIGEVFRFSKVDAIDNVNPNQLTYAEIIPWQPIYDANGDFADASRETWGPNGARANILGQESTYRNDYETFRSLGNVYAEITPIEGLKIRGTLNFDFTNLKRVGLTPDAAVIKFGGIGPSGRGNFFRERITFSSNIQTEFLIGYNKSIGDHNFDVILNASEQRIRSELSSVGSENLVFVAPIHNEAESNGGGFFTDNALIGYMGRFSYNYASKYYLDATIRRDGTSRFAEDFRFGSFPSVSAAWRISSENFMQDISFINDLKIRGGWGQLGNQVTADYQYLALANLNPKYIIGGDASGFIYQPAVAFGALPNEILSWETVTTTNIGFDGIFFNNNLNVTAEYYTRETEDILQAVQLPRTAGFQSNTVENIASATNKGIELSANYRMTFNDLEINIGGNITTVSNEVTATNRNNDPINLGDNRIEVGQPIGYIWGYQVDRILQNQQEVDAYDANTQDGAGGAKGPGDLVFKDTHTSSDEVGVEKVAGADGVVDVNDRVYLGKTIAGYFYGVNLGARYKGFDFSMLLQGIGDVQRINSHKRALEGGGFGPNKSIAVLNRWRPNNTNTEIPRYIFENPAGNDRISDRWVEDAGFMRIRNIQLGYTLPTQLLNKIGSSNFRVYVDASNIATFTDWSGLDPENDDNPVPSIFRVGLNASF